MMIFGLLLKIIYKLRLGNVFYPLFYFINKMFPNAKLPNNVESESIVNKNRHNKKNITLHNTSPYYNNSNSFYNIQIIIPAYNTGKYIKECLDSVINQKTKYHFQIIVVNDGSTDDTSRILNTYSKRHLIKLINEKNLGRSAARNTGLSYVTSKYVMFVDSDDKLAPNAIENLLNDAIKTDSDIVFGGCDFLYNTGKLAVNFKYNNNNSLHIKSDNDVDDSVCAKIFKSKLFKDVRFPVGYEFEDMMPALLIYPQCHKISSISPNVYFYRYNRSSITHSFQFSNISIDSYLVLAKIIKSYSSYNIKVNQYIYNTFLSQVKVTCMRNIYVKTKVQKSIFALICYLYSKYFSGFSTDLSYFKPLEKSLRDKNYSNYILFCIMK